MENWTNLDKGREGVKNPGNFADIICTWPLKRNRAECLHEQEEITNSERHSTACDPSV